MPTNPTDFDAKTIESIIDYSLTVTRLAAPDDVLSHLHDIIAATTSMRVLGANRFSVKAGDWRRLQLGKTVFVHQSVPRGWLDEWLAFVAGGHPIGLMTARMCVAPFTWTELSRMLEPVGIDRWPFELALKHGMRDGYLCPVGGRWVVGFWSPKSLASGFIQPARGLLYMAASAAAIRLESLVGDAWERAQV
jgi:LuxR family quorum sensing-dependent transcriptional regulator